MHSTAEPTLSTDPDLLAILDELASRERSSTARSGGPPGPISRQ